MEEVAALPMGQQRMVMALLGGFAGVALVLAALGIYSVLSYSVGQRRREFGVRVALGAQQADVVRLVVGGGARLAMVGICVGVVAALVLTRLMIDLLFGVPPADPCHVPGGVGAARRRPRSSRAMFPPGARCASIRSTCCGTNRGERSRDRFPYFGVILVILLPWMPRPAISPFCPKMTA